MPRRLSPLDYAILGLLARGRASGYDLRRVFQTTALGRYSASPGSIYPAIRRLDEDGLIVGHSAVGGRGRKLFRLTAAGGEALRRWVNEPVSEGELFRDSAVVDLRLAFVSDVAPERLGSFLDEYARAAEVYSRRLENAQDDFENEISPSAALAFHLGLTLARSRAAWVKTAAKANTA